MFAAEQAPDVWGIGRLVVDGAVTPWPVSQSDIDDEAAAAAAHLASLGVGSGDVVVIVALLSEAIHAVPMEKAAGLVGALYSVGRRHRDGRLAHPVPDQPTPAARGRGRERGRDPRAG